MPENYIGLCICTRKLMKASVQAAFPKPLVVEHTMYENFYQMTSLDVSITYLFYVNNYTKMLLTFLQSNEVNGAYHCEKKGLELAIETVGGQNIKAIVTDRHRQIAKFLRDDWKTIQHFFDIWHIAKGYNL